MVVSRPVILDTDPGHDDALAILLAVASPDEIELRAVTTVAGNVSVDQTTYNALRVLELAAAPDVPVYRGCSRPMVDEPVTAEHVHGPSGLDGPVLPEPSRTAESLHAVDYLIAELLAAEPSSVTVCLIGPMTNMGMALVKEPAIADRVAEFVIMGGSFRAGGNITPAAEFNIYVDPHAAHVVLTSGVPITLMPLDLTHQAQATQVRTAGVRSMKSAVGDAVAAMLDFASRYDTTTRGFDGYPLHDPTVIAYLLEPDTFSGRFAHVSVVTDSGYGHGQTIADWSAQPPPESNARVMTSLDSDGFFDLLTARLSRY
jgi:purine nucleosidase